MFKKLWLFLLLLLNAGLMKAQETQGKPEMADKLRESGKIYVVVGVVAIIFIGIIVYIINLDRKISKLEKKVKGDKDHIY